MLPFRIKTTKTVQLCGEKFCYVAKWGKKRVK